jgi:hypothetical protein
MKRMFLAGVALLTAVSGSAMAADMSTGPAPVLTKASPIGPANWTSC